METNTTQKQTNKIKLKHTNKKQVLQEQTSSKPQPINYTMPFQEKRNTTPDKRLLFLLKKFKKNSNSSHNILTPTLKIESLSSLQKLRLIAVLEFLRFYKKHYPETYTDLIQTINQKGLEFIYNKSCTQVFNSFFDTNKTKLYTSSYSIGTKTLTNTQLLQLISCSFVELVDIFYKTTNNPNSNNKNNKVELYKLESLLTIFWQLKQKYGLSKRFIKIMPPYYRKAFKEIYRSKKVMLSLAKFLNSKKKAKKYMRILQKRLTIYTQKKKPWK